MNRWLKCLHDLNSMQFSFLVVFATGRIEVMSVRDGSLKAHSQLALLGTLGQWLQLNSRQEKEKEGKTTVDDATDDKLIR